MGGAIRWSVAVLLALGCAGVGEAQEEVLDGYRLLPESRYGRLNASEAGKKFYLEARWNGNHGEEIYLHQAPNSRGFLWVKQGSALHAFLSGDEDGSGVSIQKKTSTVRFFATARAEGGRCVLWLNKAHKLEDDAIRYQQQLDALPQDADSRTVQALADKIRGLAQRYRDDQLAAVAKRAVLRELQARRRTLAPDDVEGALALSTRMVEVEHPEAAIELLSQVERSTSSEPQRRQIQAELRKLGAVRSGGEWLPFDQYKQREGFIARAGSDGEITWIRREAAEFEEAIEAERRLQKHMVVSIREGHELRPLKDAEQGRITRGQTMAEVRLAAKGQLPTLVNHLRARAPGPSAEIEALWSQWVLSDGRRVYFLDQGGGGEVISFKAASIPWPE